MVNIKSKDELTNMKKAGIIVALAHRQAQSVIQPGVSIQEVNRAIEECILLNDTILHEGDIVSVDIGACYQGYHGDSAWTYAVGKVSEEAQQLMEIGEASLFAGLRMAKAGNHLTDISAAIGEYVFSHGCTLPQNYGGHGIGTSVHEEPVVPNFGPAGQGLLLEEGMTLAIEPLVIAGRPQTRLLDDGYSVATRDGSLAVHYEHTIVITKDGYEILTKI